MVIGLVILFLILFIFFLYDTLYISRHFNINGVAGPVRDAGVAATKEHLNNINIICNVIFDIYESSHRERRNEGLGTRDC